MRKPHLFPAAVGPLFFVALSPPVSLAQVTDTTTLLPWPYVTLSTSGVVAL